MSKTKLTVKTEFGTFTRTTARTYTHFVIIKGQSPDAIRGHFTAELKYEFAQAAKYDAATAFAQAAGGGDVKVISEDGCSINSAEWLRVNRKPKGTLRIAAPGDFGFTAREWSQYAADVRARILTHDERLAAALAKNEAEDYGVVGWCGRFDLAAKLAATWQKRNYLNVKIISVATGEQTLY